ncbi:MAG TPA: hypothetical protein VHP37_28110 [Burkholderiales bacterium]|nr:hypothetical protein [Burkholderiales bacterium]
MSKTEQMLRRIKALDGQIDTAAALLQLDASERSKGCDRPTLGRFDNSNDPGPPWPGEWDDKSK